MSKPEQVTLADEPRKRPYVWPKWVARLLAGDDRCWYSAWYKAHHQYLKRKDDEDKEAFFAEYNATHDRLVQERATALRSEGWTVKVEGEGAFRVSGKLGDVSGKPDIVAMRGKDALVVDAKSGKPRGSDHMQVALYMTMLPKDWLKGFTRITGELEYRDGTVPVKPMTSSEYDRASEALRRVMGAEPPEAAPSRNECRFCDIARCKYRADDRGGDSGGMF